MTIAILALQGAFAEHQQMLQLIGVDSVLIRNLNDWNHYLYGGAMPSPHHFSSPSGKALIIPGGESTAMMKIMNDEGLTTPIRDAILSGMPVFGTCAGLILLDGNHLATMDIQVRRNAYGRQLGSFSTQAEFRGIGNIPMTFIRAPYIESTGEGVEVLATVDGHIVAARQQNQLVCAFHPELTADTKVHEYFIRLLQNS